MTARRRKRISFTFVYIRLQMACKRPNILVLVQTVVSGCKRNSFATYFTAATIFYHLFLLDKASLCAVRLPDPDR